MEQVESTKIPEPSPYTALSTDDVSQPEGEHTALAATCVDHTDMTEDWNFVTSTVCLDISMMDHKLRPIEQQLQYLLNKADEYQAQLVYSRHDSVQKQDSARVLPNFLWSCHSYFTYLEGTARSIHPQQTLIPPYIHSRLLFFSQQLCARLEKLLLMYASYDLISLEETEPCSISHFYTGQCQIDGVKLSMFRYCRPAPYLAGVNTGLYKCMRWNVERPREMPQHERNGDMQGEAEDDMTVAGRETINNIEYFFLCYEDVNEEPITDNGEVATGNVVRMWSIGQWVQTHPDPEADDILNWVLCDAPQADYYKLLCLGEEEPSTCSATDFLLRALCLQQSPVESPSLETCNCSCSIFDNII
ncbi:hypothetical protein UPYG_G00066240 [Umbra pygmaea]|uniref:Uncharacterized protein n=1 Tax=Umbra pygmaea TaxID=75934 RepID=A0ABD0XQB8_UMBPY